MTQQHLHESPEKKQRLIESRGRTLTNAQSFQGGLHPVAQLQGTMGNRNVAKLIQARRLTPEGKIIGLQRKLTVGAPNDPYEQEADRVASQVLNTPDAVAVNTMQRSLSPKEDKDKMLQTRLIQRGGPHKAGDAEQEEIEALINFKDDWRNNFSHYDQLITISGRSYNKNQKVGIKAVKKGDSISITLGKPYFTESDEKIRWQWIKTEVIDKHVKTDKFEDIAFDPTHSRINEIAPPYAAGQYCALNCPATAASLDEYLRTGKVSPAICNPSKERIKGYGFDISKNTFSKSVSWKQAVATIKKQLKKHGDFVIVEATRSEKQMKDNNVAKTHYFAVVNVKGRLFAMDAFGGGIVNDNVQDYIDNRIIATTYRIVDGEFKVKEVIPKS